MENWRAAELFLAVLVINSVKEEPHLRLLFPFKAKMSPGSLPVQGRMCYSVRVRYGTKEQEVEK